MKTLLICIGVIACITWLYLGITIIFSPLVHDTKRRQARHIENAREGAQ